MVVGVHEKPHELGRARDRTQDGLWFPHRANQESGSARRRNDALGAAYRRRVRPCPSPPLGVVAPHRIPRLAAVACLARYASSLAGVTFTPAQPPSVINSPCEKTNLTQKQPYRRSRCACGGYWRRVDVGSIGPYMSGYDADVGRP